MCIADTKICETVDTLMRYPPISNIKIPSSFRSVRILYKSPHEEGIRVSIWMCHMSSGLFYHVPSLQRRWKVHDCPRPSLLRVCPE